MKKLIWMLALAAGTAAAQTPHYLPSQGGTLSGPISFTGTAAAQTMANLGAWIDPRNPSFAGGAKCDGTTNDTAAVQAAISYGAAHTLPVSFWGCPSLLVGTLTTPSNTEIYAFRSLIKLVSGTNAPLLENPNQSFTTRGDQNIRIHGGVWDGNAANQADTTSAGVLTQGLQFVGVDGVTLDGLTVQDMRRFNVWFVNAQDITVVNGMRVIDASVGSNHAGIQFNGYTYNVNIDSITHINGGDDTLALNADDQSMGGTYTSANISGRIANVRVGQINCQSCRNGVRLLSATYEIRNVSIDAINGDYSVFAFNADDGGFGSGGGYYNIRIGSIAANWNALPSGLTPFYPMVRMETTNVSSAEPSTFDIGSITCVQQSAGDTRGTASIDTAHNTRVNIGRIHEFDRSSTVGLNITSPTTTTVRVGHYAQNGATVATYPIAVSGGTLGRLELQEVSTDNPADLPYPLYLNSGAAVTTIVYGADYAASAGAPVLSLTGNSSVGTFWVLNGAPAAGPVYTLTAGSSVTRQYPWGSAWAQSTPTVTAGTGTMTTVSAVLRTLQLGKTWSFSVTVTITNAGTGAADLRVVMPFSAVSPGATVACKEVQNTGAAGTGSFNATRGLNVLDIVGVSNGTLIATGNVVNCSGTVEAQ